MKSKPGKIRKRWEDYFGFYIETVSDVFSFLVTEYGCEQVSVGIYPPECAIKYRNATTGVTITYESKSSVWVNLARLKHTPGEITEAERYDLMLLMELRCPEKDRKQFFGSDKEWSDEYIRRVLQEYAGLLKQHAGEMLTGDFSIFPALKKLRAHYRRQQNKELFGTYSGGSPRFFTRPTLAEVFAGAKDVDLTLERLFGGKLNQDKTNSRVYEAYWDHEYSVPEIARFLGVSDAEVERILDEVDGYG